MPDMNRAIGDLRWIASALSAGETVRRDDRAIASIQTVIDKLNAQPDVVRCKDCKHYHKGFTCDLLQKPILKDENWFCADGERGGAG